MPIIKQIFLNGNKLKETNYNLYRRGIKMSIDPVCHMEIDEKSAPANYEYKGKTYYFCAIACKRAFEKDPEKYLPLPKPQLET